MIAVRCEDHTGIATFGVRHVDTGRPTVPKP